MMIGKIVHARGRDLAGDLIELHSFVFQQATLAGDCITSAPRAVEATNCNQRRFEPYTSVHEPAHKEGENSRQLRGRDPLCSTFQIGRDHSVSWDHLSWSTSGIWSQWIIAHTLPNSSCGSR